VQFIDEHNAVDVVVAGEGVSLVYKPMKALYEQKLMRVGV